MKFPHFLPRAVLVAGAALMPLFPTAAGADPAVVVLQNGRSVPVSALSVKGDSLVVTTAAAGFTAGQAIPLSTADHVYGDKPAKINAGIAALLSGNPGEALKLLEPIVDSERVTASIPGNFWMEAAKATLVAYAVNRDADKCEKLGKEISAASPSGASDPFVALGKALLLPPSAKIADRETALRDLTIADLHSPICAYASFYLGNLLRDAKRAPEALEAYLMVPCLFPAGGIILNAAAELNASEFLNALGRREEAVKLLKASVRDGKGTSLATEANKRLESAQ
jgi:tetratricopeptide (TPR) repeat protein